MKLIQRTGRDKDCDFMEFGRFVYAKSFVVTGGQKKMTLSL